MKKKKRKVPMQIILFIMISLVLGILLGLFTRKSTFSCLDIFYTHDTLGIEILKLLIIITMIFLSFLLQIVIHEGGHLIFGLLSGYKFVSFRIGSATFIRDQGKWKIKKFNLPGTGGQCLLMPPEEEEDFPFIMYNLGGVLLNCIFGIIPILISGCFKEISWGMETFLKIFGGVGILCFLLNGIPLKVTGIANDGSNVLSMMKNKEARHSFYMQLRFNGLLSEGKRPRDMNINDFKLKDGADLSNPLNTAMILMKYNVLLDNLDFKGGRDLLNGLTPYEDKLITLYRYEINCERIFLELVLNGDRDLVHKLYDRDLVKYIKACKGMIGKKRVLMAYELLYHKDIDKAFKFYEEGKKLSKTYPIKGEITMEIMVMDYLWDITP